jgi:hypothetical protein
MISIQRLRQEVADTEQETMLAEIRQSVIELWERETGRAWLLREDYQQTFRLEHDMHSTLFLELLPVTEVTLVESRRSTSTTWEEIDAATYDLAPAGMLLRVGTYWPTFVRVTYDGGYDDDSCPAAIRGALAVQARFMLRRMQDLSLTVRSQNFEGGAGVYFEPHLHPHFLSMAKAHARKV